MCSSVLDALAREICALRVPMARVEDDPVHVLQSYLTRTRSLSWTMCVSVPIALQHGCKQPGVS